MNLTGTNWRIKDAPSLSAIGLKHVNFESNDETFSSLTIAADGIKYGSTLAYGEKELASVAGFGVSSETPADVSFTVSNSFPTSFEEVTIGNNVFVKIPTIYRKVDTVVETNSRYTITAFSMALAAADSSWHPYSCFVAEDASTVLPYVLIGKYVMSSSSVANSVSGTPVAQTIGTARTNAKALGSGYQLYDWQMQKLFQDLALIADYKLNGTKVNFQDGTAARASFLGISDLDQDTWVDGVASGYGNQGKYVFSNYPSKYADSAVASTDGYQESSYNAAGNSACIKYLGYTSNQEFFNFPTYCVISSNYSNYLCDAWKVPYGQSENPVITNVGSASAGSGLFNTQKTKTWSQTAMARLCYRPIS